MQKILRIATVIMTCLAVGYISSIITRENIPAWYALINKPFFTPPNWVFVPVWTLLYIMMGFAAGSVWNKIDTEEANVKKAFLFFLIQLALNALWSFLFFGLQSYICSISPQNYGKNITNDPSFKPSCTFTPSPLWRYVVLCFVRKTVFKQIKYSYS